MTYEEALSYIHQVSWRGSRPGLSRITELCRRLGDPQDRLRFVHVAGTNGKGSFCSMLSSVLTAAGYRVGTFTSPYIVRFNDRMCIDGREIGDEALASLVEEIRPIAESMEDKPTEFELISALGFLWFSRQACDVVVLECGMGGRYDSTNVIKTPLLSVITGIDYDHMGILGNTLSEIAWEKAGIIKSGCPVLMGEAGEEAADVIRREAAEKNAPLTAADYGELTVHAQTLSGTVFDFASYRGMRISLLGDYQPRNASLVLCAVRLLKNDLGISGEDVRAGLENARWRARFELLSKEPTVLYDGGHNRQGVRLCVESFRRYFDGKANLITGVMADKDYLPMAEMLSPIAATVTTLSPNNPRALSPEAYASVFSSLGVPATPAASEKEAVRQAFLRQKENGLPILCTGSLYMYERLSREIALALHK